jgi:hypothetical protein
LIENRWVLEKNQHSNKIKQFLRFTKYDTLDELVNLSKAEIEYILLEYVEDLQHINALSTIISKVDSVVMFYSVNDIDIHNELTSEWHRKMEWYYLESDD